MKIKKQVSEKSKESALRTQERLKRRRESNAYIPYRIPRTVFPGPKAKDMPLMIIFLLLSFAAEAQNCTEIFIRNVDSSWHPLYIQIDSVHPPHYYLKNDTIVFSERQDSTIKAAPFLYNGGPRRSLVNLVPGFIVYPPCVEAGDTLWTFSVWRKNSFTKQIGHPK